MPPEGNDGRVRGSSGQRPSAEKPALTQLLRQWRAGDESVFDRLDPGVYRQLRRRAAALMARERSGHTLRPTALVHEAFLLLQEDGGIEWQDRKHFYAFVAHLMRRVLIHHARRKAADKRGGDEKRVTLMTSFADAANPSFDLLDLDRALRELEELDPRQAKVVELRFFTGLDVRETADVMGLSPATVKRDWGTARAWLALKLTSS